MAFPESWVETALISMQIKGGTAYHFGSITETVDISEGDYPVEGMPMVGGARIVKQSPQEDGELTLEIYPLELDTTASAGFFQEFAGGTWDTSEPLATDTSWLEGIDRPRDRFMIAVLWTDDQSASNAFAATTDTDKTALRFYAKEARITSHKVDFTDGIVKATVTFKFPALDAAGTTRPYAWESTDDTDTSALPALSYS